VRGEVQYGQWDRLVRVLAAYNPLRCPEILGWPLRDALLAYEEHLKERAREDYKDAVLVFAVLAPHLKKGAKPPKIPRILRER